MLLLGNKTDLLPDIATYRVTHATAITADYAWTLFSAKAKDNIQRVRDLMIQLVQRFADSSAGQPLISNVRHLDALRKAQASIEEVRDGLANGLTGDLLSIDIRTVLHYIGEITGEISNDEVLGNIFGKFCIGK